MSDARIASLGVKGLGAAFGAGDLTPVDAVEAYARRIEAFNPELNAFLDLRVDAALEDAARAAKRWREGAPLSRIDGVPFGVKANIAVKGLPWHGGIGAYRDRVATEDGDCVSALRDAGAIPLGILNMHEGALGATTDNPHFGKCRNPWNADLVPGGSSGGSGTAVAAGLCTFSLGTDTMGSVRIPSAYCGVAGHKPSYGLVPAGGLVDLSPTLDHVGPHARDAADLADVLPFLSGAPLAPAPEKLRIGIASWGDAVDVEADVADAFNDARAILSAIGHAVHVDLSGFEFGALRRKGLLVSEVEGFSAHEEMLVRDPDGFSEAFGALLRWGAKQPKEKVYAAYKGLRDAGEQFAALFAGCDVIAVPTAPQGPFSFDAAVPANQADFTAMANFGGFPATAVPANTNGAPPASIQFMAPKGEDHLALAAARLFEEERGSAPRPAAYFSD